MMYTSTGTGEWPQGIHWTPGESKDVPADWPADMSDRPHWLEPEAPPQAKPAARVKAKGAARG